MNSPYKAQIEDLIRNSDFGITSSQIANKLGIAWRTVDKYLKELVRDGRVTSHMVGAYSVFIARKLGEQPVYQLLYTAAIKIGSNMVQGVEFQPDKVPRFLRETWEELGNHVTLPFENEIPHVKGTPNPEFFELLIEVTKRILGEFGYFGNYPKVETIPPLGKSSPLTRLIQLKDPGFIRSRTWTHFHLLANFLEYKLTKITGIPVFFHVAGEIRPQDEMVYFEIGLVENYYIDLSIVQISDPSKNARFYLDIIKNFFSTFFRMKVREYSVGDILHYEGIFLDNQQLDEFFSLRAKSLRKNKEIFEKLKLKGTRKWVPYEDWPDPFIVVDFINNVGFAVDDYFQAMGETFPEIGYNLWIEIIPGGKRLNFLEPFDFDILFFNQFDDASVREHYRKLGITSEEFLTQRKQALLDLWAEIRKKRPEKIKQKRMKTKEKANAALT